MDISEGRIWLLSDGQIVQTNWLGCGPGIEAKGWKFTLPQLSAGVVWTDFAGLGCRGWLLSSDGMLIDFLGLYPDGSYIPYPVEDGVKYVKILAGASDGFEVNMLLRSDGKVTITPGLKRCEGDLPEECQTYVYTTDRSDYIDGVLTSHYALLLRADGEIDRWQLPRIDPGDGDHDYTCLETSYVLDYKKGPWCEPGWVPAGSLPPVLPKGLGYTQIASDGYVTAFIRSDGKAFAKGIVPEGVTVKAPKIPALPAGLTYVHAEVIDHQVILLRSDGNLVVARTDVYTYLVDHSKPDGIRKVKWTALKRPSIPQGWVFTGLVDRDHSAQFIAQGQYSNRLTMAQFFGIARIAPGQKVASVVSKATAGGGVVKGKPATLTVTVSTRAVAKGGKVQVSKGGRVIGTARLNANNTATVKVDTSRFKTAGNTTVQVKFAGRGQAAPSRSIHATIKTQR
jgi:hypothetical protein